MKFIRTNNIIAAMLVLSGANIVHAVDNTRGYTSIEKASAKGNIKLIIKANGKGFSGNCIDLSITNRRNDSGFYRLEAGRKFKASDSTMQNILVAHQQLFKLGPRETKHVQVFGFCCQHSHHAPAAALVYGVGKMADSGLVALAQFLNAHDFELYAMQEAVWVISDNFRVCCIADNHQQELMPLVAKVAAIKKVEIPSYSTIYQRDKSGMLTYKPLTISGLVNYYVPTNSEVEVYVYNEYGSRMHTISYGLANPDTYNLPFTLDVKGWANGKYYVRVFIDGIKKKETEFEL